VSTPSWPPPLLADGWLGDVPGGPYDQGAVEIACSTVRGECGWHIAPEVTEQLVVPNGGGGPSVVLPTLRVVEVTEVRDRATGAVLDGWDWSAAGVLTRPGGWPVGPRALLVSLVHGYPEAPAEVVGLVAELAAAFRSAPAGARQEVRTVGGVTVNRSFTESGPTRGVLDAFGHVLDRYRVSVPT